MKSDHDNFLYNGISLKDLRRRLRRKQTDAERVLWHKLKKRQLGFKFYRQYSVGNYILDFYCSARRLAIELDGSQHMEDAQRSQDEVRSRFLEENHIRILRFWDGEVLNNIEGVLEAILQVVTPSNSPLS